MDFTSKDVTVAVAPSTVNEQSLLIEADIRPMDVDEHGVLAIDYDDDEEYAAITHVPTGKRFCRFDGKEGEVQDFVAQLHDRIGTDELRELRQDSKFSIRNSVSTAIKELGGRR